jgi:hypothetical protein
MAVDTFLLGSSFVSRVEQYIGDSTHGRKNNFGLQRHFAQVHVSGVPGLNVSPGAVSLHRRFDYDISRAAPEVVVMHAGANDLSHEHRTPLCVAADIHDYSLTLLHEFGVRHVVVCSACTEAL